jgi:hypothetical protein
MRKEFVMRGKTASGKTEVLNFSGYKPGVAFRLVKFELFPSTNIVSTTAEMVGSITAGKSAILPSDPDFNDEALIATAFWTNREQSQTGYDASVVNDMFLITQNLILMVECAEGPVNWQCRFVAEKMSGPEEAATNYKQFLISDGS